MRCFSVVDRTGVRSGSPRGHNVCEGDFTSSLNTCAMTHRMIENSALRIFLVVFGLACCQSLLAQDAAVPAEAVAEQSEQQPVEQSSQGDAAATDEVIAHSGNLGAPAEESPGQSDLDEAIVKRIDADSQRSLEAVSALLESAIQKGLDPENQSFAKKMLGSVLLQRGQAVASQLKDARGRRVFALRDEALELLDQASTHDPTLIEAYMLISQLNMLEGGSLDSIVDATTKAIELLEDDDRERSAALVLRANARRNDQEKLVDLDEAIKADPENKNAIRLRAGLRLKVGDVEGAITDLEGILLDDPTNAAVVGAVVTQLLELDRLTEARELLTKMLEAKPSEGLYRMRASLYRAEENYDAAKSDLDKAIAMSPKDPTSLIQRSMLAIDRDDIKSAKADFREALRIAPVIINAEECIELRLQIALKENRHVDAINDAKLLVEKAPEDTFRRLRLATLYTIDKRPRKAIDLMSEILQDDSENVAVLRSRGDAFLSVGEHGKAIADYESAISSLGNVDPSTSSERDINEASGLYNNLSWVLATSPKDSVRNGGRALELAEKSAELTQYKAPHILSTLAAAYAEKGDFENARKWSNEAVKLATEESHDQLDQLKEEADTYQRNEPWREAQDTEENDVPLLSPEDLIDT